MELKFKEVDLALFLESFQGWRAKLDHLLELVQSKIT